MTTPDPFAPIVADAFLPTPAVRPSPGSPVRPVEGYQVRVYLPYGDQWYGYLMRRLAERPRNVAFFARALASRN